MSPQKERKKSRRKRNGGKKKKSVFTPNSSEMWRHSKQISTNYVIVYQKNINHWEKENPTFTWGNIDVDNKVKMGKYLPENRSPWGKWVSGLLFWTDLTQPDWWPSDTLSSRNLCVVQWDLYLIELTGCYLRPHPVLHPPGSILGLCFLEMLQFSKAIMPALVLILSKNSFHLWLFQIFPIFFIKSFLFFDFSLQIKIKYIKQKNNHFFTT